MIISFIDKYNPYFHQIFQMQLREFRAWFRVTHKRLKMLQMQPKTDLCYLETTPGVPGMVQIYLETILKNHEILWNCVWGDLREIFFTFPKVLLRFITYFIFLIPCNKQIKKQMAGIWLKLFSLLSSKII